MELEIGVGVLAVASHIALHFAIAASIALQVHILAMSDSEEQIAVPSDDVITEALKQATGRRFKNDEDSVTVNSVRSEAERDLALPDGFLKSNDNWKDASKTIIREHVVCYGSLSLHQLVCY